MAFPPSKEKEHDNNQIQQIKGPRFEMLILSFGKFTDWIHIHSYLDQQSLNLSLSFTHSDEFISTYKAHLRRERIFQFSSESIAMLKAKTNEGSNINKVSSFQAMSALVWRSTVRANSLPHKEVTKCRMTVASSIH